MWSPRERIFSYGYWFRRWEFLKTLRYVRHEEQATTKLSKKDLLESRGAIKMTWTSEARNFYHYSHLLVNDLIMKIKYGELLTNGSGMLAESLHLISAPTIVFYYSNNSKSYFVECIFAYFSRLAFWWAARSSISSYRWMKMEERRTATENRKNSFFSSHSEMCGRSGGEKS